MQNRANDGWRASGSSPPALDRTPGVNAELVRRFHAEHPAVYNRALAYVSRRLGVRPTWRRTKTRAGRTEPFLDHSPIDKARELLHDGVVTAMTSPTPYRGTEANFYPWFLAIVESRVKDYWRRRGRQREALAALRVQIRIDSGTQTFGGAKLPVTRLLLAPAEPTDASRSQVEEAAARVLRFGRDVGQVNPAEWARAFVDHRDRNVTLGQAAAALGVSPATVKRRFKAIAAALENK